MEQNIIKLEISNEYILGSGVSIGAVGSHDDVLLEMDFRPSKVWAGTTRRAIFSNALGEQQTLVLLGCDLLAEGQEDVYLVPVPPEAKTVAGECFLTVEGIFVNSAGQEVVRCVTEEARFRVQPSKLYTGEETPVTPSQAQQLQVEIDRIKTGIVEAKAAGAAAAESEKNAKASEDAAADSAEAAAASETTAGQRAAQAADSEAAAKASAEEAAGFADTAKTHLDDAKQSAYEAALARNNAKLNQQAAQAAQSNAESQASTATAAASRAEASAATAAGKASEAAGCAAAAQTAEENAKAAEENAAASAKRAEDSAKKVGDIVSGDFATESEFQEHTGDATRHITAAERSSWNSRAAGTHSHKQAEISGLVARLQDFVARDEGGQFRASVAFGENQAYGTPGVVLHNGLFFYDSLEDGSFVAVVSPEPETQEDVGTKNTLRLCGDSYVDEKADRIGETPVLLQNLADPTEESDAANAGFVTKQCSELYQALREVLDGKLDAAGGEMTGSIIANPSSAGQMILRNPAGSCGIAVTKDGLVGMKSAYNIGLTIEKETTITGLAEPSSDDMPAPKGYVDAALGQMPWRLLGKTRLSQAAQTLELEIPAGALADKSLLRLFVAAPYVRTGSGNTYTFMLRLNGLDTSCYFHQGQNSSSQVINSSRLVNGCRLVATSGSMSGSMLLCSADLFLTDTLVGIQATSQAHYGGGSGSAPLYLNTETRSGFCVGANRNTLEKISIEAVLGSDSDVITFQAGSELLLVTTA